MRETSSCSIQTLSMNRRVPPAPFGDHKLKEVIRRNQLRSPSKSSDKVLSEVRSWQPSFVTRQEDITPIIIDVANSRWNANAEYVEATPE